MSAQQGPASQSEAEAQRLWSEFGKTVWSATPEKWSQLHPDAACETFHGVIWASGADRQWTQRCSEGSREIAAHWTFYIFSVQAPLLTHLEQFDANTTTLPGDLLRQVQQVLQARLSARYGPGQDHSPANPRVRVVAWPNYVSWQNGDLQVHLNLSEFDPKRNEGRLSLLARHRPLLDALAEDDRLKKIDVRAYVSQVGSPIDEDLSRELLEIFPILQRCSRISSRRPIRRKCAPPSSSYEPKSEGKPLHNQVLAPQCLPLHKRGGRQNNFTSPWYAC